MIGAEFNGMFIIRWVIYEVTEKQRIKKRKNKLHSAACYLLPASETRFRFFLNQSRFQYIQLLRWHEKRRRKINIRQSIWCEWRRDWIGMHLFVSVNWAAKTEDDKKERKKNR